MTRSIVTGAIVTACLAGLVLAGCGSKKKTEDADAADVAEEDTAIDETVDVVPDAEPDAVPDAEEDATPDAEEDAETDGPLDPPEDWPTDNPADWSVETSTACEAVGGFCTAVRWEICPVGYEPIDPDPHRGCGGGGGVAGWCCVVAPYSTCSAYAGGNCIPGTSCTGCWGDVSGYTCESGRVCCEDICD